MLLRLELWLHNVQDDGHSVFIIVPYNPLVGVRCIAHDNAVLLAGELGWVVGVDILLDLFSFHLHVLLLLGQGHDEASVFDEFVC